MTIRKFASSHRSVLEDFKAEDIAPSIEIAGLEESDKILPVIKALGMLWVTDGDFLTFRREELIKATWSKRYFEMFCQPFRPVRFSGTLCNGSACHIPGCSTIRCRLG